MQFTSQNIQLKHNYNTKATSTDKTGERGLYTTVTLRLTPQAEGFIWDDLRTILDGGQTMADGEEVLPKASIPLSRPHQRYVTDRRICDSIT